MNLVDRVRVERAIWSYDWWLDLSGANGRRRRELRRELRTNLRDAAAHVGVRDAVRALGGAHRMAAEALPADPTRPRWTVGVSAALVTVAAVVLVQFWAALAWVDGVLAADPDEPVTGSITLMPGSSMEYVPDGSGFSVVMGPGWSALVVGLFVLVVVSRPWRYLTTRSGKPDDRHVASVG